MKVLTVFIDGLKPESIEYMPFLNTLNKRRIRTELGYSNTCHASMYTGVYPNKHLMWFLWKYSPNTSPFRWLKSLGSHLLNNIYIKYTCYRITKFLYGHKYMSAFKLPFLWYIPIKYWHCFDVIEKKFWDQPNYIEKYPTIFELLRNNNIDYEIVGFSKSSLDRSFELIKNYKFKKIATWTYLFVGDIDLLSHRYGQDSPEVKEKLKEIDLFLEKIYKLYEKQFDDFCFFLFSDHGHMEIRERINPYSLFRSKNYPLENYIHFVDSNYLRFWFRNRKEREEVIKALSALEDKGFILTKDILKQYHVNMPDNRYGDLVFYLDFPYVFKQGNIFIMGKEWSGVAKYTSFHGFLPDYPDMDGVFISNKKATSKPYIKLEDITPSILHLFNLKVPQYMDGEVIWKEIDTNE